MRKVTKKEFGFFSIEKLNFQKEAKTSQIKERVERAISDVISYETLPSQIDYRVSEKTRAGEAIEFLTSLPKGLRRMYFDRIENAIEEHHTPMACGHSPAELNDMF